MATRKTSKRPRARRRGAPKRKPQPRAVEAALAGIAHDIRTPLTGILALAELLASSDLGERERQWANAVKSGAEHLAAPARRDGRPRARSARANQGHHGRDRARARPAGIRRRR
jgi:signal transduction histidine kinase